MSVRVIHGDCLDVLPTLPPVAAVVTDPPYGISFMGKSWDHGVPSVPYWRAVLDAMLPGAHLVAFGGTRTFHRLTCAIEDAGFDIRDTLCWLYGSGFPKSLDVSKAIDKAAGAERQITGYASNQGHYDGSPRQPGRKLGRATYAQDSYSREMTRETPITAPATPDAERWQGWGTALKPAWEPIILARKPLSERTVAANVLAHGTGGLNIDAARIDSPVTPGDAVQTPGSGLAGQRTYGDWAGTYSGPTNPHPLSARHHAAGRWPSNVALSHESECREVGVRRIKGNGRPNCDGREYGNDGAVTYGKIGPQPYTARATAPDGTETVAAWECAESCAVAALDRMSGERPSRAGRTKPTTGTGYGTYAPMADGPSYGADSGGASRFMYCAKASTSERGAGNDHATVKPLALMTWLIKLVTPPGGVILDPFAGSGTTLLAASRLGFSSIGIDSDAHACEIARRRLAEDAPMFAEVSG